jgi:hypothetical protein
VGIGKRHGLPVIEDAACASGSAIMRDGALEYIGRPHADIAAFSFHPRKVISTGDGGMLTTNNPQYDAQFRLLRQHGMSVNDRVRHSAREVVFEEHAVLGYNYRMTDIQAAVGREQLKRLPDIVARRRELAETYKSLLAGVPGLELPAEPDWARTNWQSYGVRFPAYCNQRSVMQAMLDSGISTRRGIMCSHREPAYAELALRPLAHRSASDQTAYGQESKRDSGRCLRQVSHRPHSLSWVSTGRSLASVGAVITAPRRDDQRTSPASRRRSLPDRLRSDQRGPSASRLSTRLPARVVNDSPLAWRSVAPRFPIAND